MALAPPLFGYLMLEAAAHFAGDWELENCEPDGEAAFIVRLKQGGKRLNFYGVPQLGSPMFCLAD